MTEILNALEAAMHEAIDGTATMEEFFATLTASQIIVPSQTEVKKDGSGLSPLAYDAGDGTQMIIAFTHPDRVGPAFHDMAQFELKVDAAWLVTILAPELGVMLFGGHDFGFQLMPAQLAGVRAALQEEPPAGSG